MLIYKRRCPGEICYGAKRATASGHPARRAQFPSMQKYTNETQIVIKIKININLYVCVTISKSINYL